MCAKVSLVIKSSVPYSNDHVRVHHRVAASAATRAPATAPKLTELDESAPLVPLEPVLDVPAADPVLDAPDLVPVAVLPEAAAAVPLVPAAVEDEPAGATAAILATLAHAAAELVASLPCV